MISETSPFFIAFAGKRQIASGSLLEVAVKAQAATQADNLDPVLIFAEATSRVVDMDLRGTAAELIARLSAEATAPPQPAQEDELTRRPGRPKLGVVPREVTLLPRHWDWLATQPGGASVALRRLVEEARRANQEKDRQRVAQEVAYRFISTMAGNEPGFEEAARALFAGDRERFEAQVEGWPVDVANHAKHLVARALGDDGAETARTTP